VLAGAHHLYIVPHGILHYVPSPCFLAVGVWRPGSCERLRHRLPAGGSGAGLRQREREPAESVMAMAPARARLQYSRQEATAVAGLFPKTGCCSWPPAPRRARSRPRPAATRYCTWRHTVLQQLQPLLSGLELEADGREDGRLEVHEILGLR